jgi:hypothetical protein
MGTGQVDLGDFRDRAAAIQAFQILHDGGEDFQPSEIAPSAIANGWDMAAARELQEIAEKTRKGVRLRGSPQAGQRWAANALGQWPQPGASADE